MRKIKLLLGAAIFVFSSANAAILQFNDFSDTSGLQLNGSSSVVNYNGQDVLRLTNDRSQAGSAFSSSPIAINNDYSFSTSFSFQITGNQGCCSQDGADGLAFVLQTNASTVGGSGGGIGYAGIPNSIAIEFDTFNNGGIDNNNGNHVGLGINGNLASNPLVPVSPDFNNGNVWYSWIDYLGATDTLEVRLSESSTRPAAFLFDYTVDLAGILNTPDAYAGFTSGTGGAGGDHDIRSWTFVDNFDPIGAVPEPSIIALFGAGLFAMGFVGRRKLKA